MLCVLAIFIFRLVAISRKNSSKKLFFKEMLRRLYQIAKKLSKFTPDCMATLARTSGVRRAFRFGTKKYHLGCLLTQLAKTRSKIQSLFFKFIFRKDQAKIRETAQKFIKKKSLNIFLK